MINIIVVDNDTIIRDIVQRILEDSDKIHLDGKFEDGYSALEYIKKNKVDLVLLDIGMPKINGMEVLQKIKNLNSDTKVVMLTACKDKGIVLKCLNMGADGYISKEIDCDGVINTILKVYEGETVTYPKVSDLMTEDMDQIRKQIEENTKIKNLTERELNVMFLISKGMSNKKIAEKLGISDKTVKNHVSNILKKLSLNDRTQIAVYTLNNNITGNEY